jgi:hypothetical protein
VRFQKCLRLVRGGELILYNGGRGGDRQAYEKAMLARPRCCARKFHTTNCAFNGTCAWNGFTGRPGLSRPAQRETSQG